MTNKELLAELKVCYEYIDDIKENHENRFDDKEKQMLWNMKEQINKLYRKVYSQAIESEYKDDDIKVKTKKDFGDEELIIGSSVDTDYHFVKKGTLDIVEDEYGCLSYITCADVDIWWHYEELGHKHNDIEYKQLANGFMRALDVISDLSDKANVYFDYYDTTCDLLGEFGFTNSRVLDFLDEFGSENDD